MSGIIYVATCVIDGKVYVGQTFQDMSERRKQHLRSKQNLTICKRASKIRGRQIHVAYFTRWR